MVLNETWNLSKIENVKNHWACGRPTGKYKGIYPNGFLKRLDNLLNLKNKKILSLFCGISEIGDTIDINPKLKSTFTLDCTKKLPIKNNTYDVIADPPYDSYNINYSMKLYQKNTVKPYSFTEEAVRVCKIKGFICILHQLVYKTLKKTERFAVIPITTGPNQRIRVLNIFKKVRK